MKAFILALLVLVLLVGAVVTNCVYVHRVESRLLSMIASLPDPSDENCLPACREIRDLWDSASRWIGFSASYTLIDRVNEQAVLLCATAEIGDLFGFRSARALLADSLGDVCRLEKV